METKTVLVIGAGTMGNGIAHVFAQYGHEVLLLDVQRQFLKNGMATIAANLERQVKKGVLTNEERRKTIARIHPTTRLSTSAAAADFVVEAATEHLETKRTLFRDIDKSARPGVILASNTSSISITLLASATSRPDRVIGMHFMNPVPVMKLVEVIRGHATSDDTMQHVVALCKRLEKTPVEVNDYPGFVANRVLMPMINEAIDCVMEGVATPDAVDSVMKLGMGHPMGPLALADFIGLDVCLAIMNVMHEGLGEPRYRPSPLLKKMVAAGQLGKKSGQGFYSYKENKGA
ncbi:MAG: 3-hydroxybutyryl-CoA dehydrogenase [Bacteroidetes bacterium]|nr:3-hydroxybutyryl-CoA dehydrogenase [Bacteroidota bacterium]